MQELLVGSVAELEGDRRLIVDLAGTEISVFERGGRYFAYENRCLHQGGPVGEGVVMPRIEAVLGPNRESIEERFDESVLHLVCPWHGWEYDLDSGECIADRALKLKSFEVRVREGDIYVVA